MSPDTLRRRQHRWAVKQGLDIIPPGYTRTLAQNLRRALQTQMQAAFEAAGQHELRPSAPGLPPKLQALHSSAALVVNVFDYWLDHDPAQLTAVFEAPSPVTSVAIEVPFPTGLEGDPPTLDVVLRGKDGHIIAIESKFTEPWSRRQPPRPFKEKYFAGGIPVWDRHAMPRAARHAEALQSGHVRYRHLNAAQLLKQALALRLATGDRHQLLYLYMPAGTRQDQIHERELDDLRTALADEVPLRIMTYPLLFERLAGIKALEGSDYLLYLQDRYLPRRNPSLPSVPG